MSVPQPAAPAPVPTPPKKGSNILMWILLGCGGILFLGAIAVVVVSLLIYSAAKSRGFTDTELMDENPALYSAQLIVKNDPDREFISLDKAKGTITFKDKKSGKTVTWTAKDIADGKYAVEATDEHGNVERTEVDASGGKDGKGTISIKTDKGETTWGGTAKPPAWMPVYTGAEVLAGATQNDEDGERGGYSLKTTDTPEQVIAFYKKVFDTSGIAYKETLIQDGGVKTIMLVPSDANSAKRSATVAASNVDGATAIQVGYQEKK